MTITPDTKDWTWVLRRPCDECGFEAATFPVAHVGTMLRGDADVWRSILADRVDVVTRPNPGTWSTLEYACHVRDVFRIFRVRLDRMLTEDDPEFANWDQDATAVESAYGEQDPAVVASEIGESAEALATLFDSVDGEQWQRTGRRTGGSNFTVETFARYLIHDPVHHLHDVGAYGC